MRTLRVLSALAIFAIFNFACSSDDDAQAPQLEAWEVEVQELKDATDHYINYQNAVDDGLIDVSGYVPNMGHHYLNPAYADGQFVLQQPELILYAPDANGMMQMVGVEYSIIPESPDNPGSPPEGFTGDIDVWHFNEMLGQWQLHVWTILNNPNGIFESHNTALGD